MNSVTLLVFLPLTLTVLERGSFLCFLGSIKVFSLLVISPSVLCLYVHFILLTIFLFVFYSFVCPPSHLMQIILL